jgi:molybdenum cofactor cytidylyltransferase
MADAALILLAAGTSSRLGSPKQLVEIGGTALVRRLAQTGLASACRPVIAVLGAHAARSRAVLADLPLQLVENPAWASGVGSSIRAGVSRAQAEGAPGVVLLLADQVLVRAQHLDHLLATRRATGCPIVASRYDGTFGVPVFFDHTRFADLLALPDDQGCKGIIRAHADAAAFVDCPDAAVDLDTPEDLARLLELPLSSDGEPR